MAQPASVEVFPADDFRPELVMPTKSLHGEVSVRGLHERIKWTLEVPQDELAYEGLVLLVPGLGCIKRHSRGERHANAAAGEATISYAPARLSERPLEDLFVPQRLQARAADSVLTAVQHRFMETPEEIPFVRSLDPHRLTLSPHSMGGYGATSLALWRSSEIEAVIYKAAAGFGTPSWRKLHQLNLVSTATEIADYLAHEHDKTTPAHLMKSLEYFGRNPLRSLGELATCLTKDISDEIIAVSEEGVPTAYLGFENDGLVPVEPALKVARKITDVQAVMPGLGHLSPQRHPAEIAAAVRDLRKRLVG